MSQSIGELWAHFLRQNPDFQLLDFDFNRADASGGLEFTSLNRTATIEDLKTLQRLLRVHASPTVASALHAAGFHSAHQIAALPERQFTQAYAPILAGEAATGDGAELARVVHRQAVNLVERVRLHSMNLVALADPVYAQMPAHLSAAGQLSFYNGLPGYQELFGNLNYLQCEGCHSIYSPAAYYVDLMRLIGGYVTKPQDARLALRARRPDLWEIPLDCEHTEQEVPYLQIVNQILEAQVRYRLEAAASAQSGQAQGVDPLAFLATHVYPFALPFNHPLERIRGLLEHFKLTLAEVYEAFRVGHELEDVRTSIAREVLQLSPEKASLLTKRNTATTALQQAYGLAGDASLDGLSNVDTFLKQTGLSYSELESLLFQNLRRKRVLEFDGSMQVFVGNPAALQNLTGDLTLELWLYPANFADDYNPLTKAAAGEFSLTQNYSTQGTSPGYLLFYWGDTGNCTFDASQVNEFSLNITLPQGQWTHVALVRDSDNGKLYAYSSNKTGVPSGSATSSPRAGASDCDVVIGRGSLGVPYVGQIADVRIWNVVRSQEDIEADMHRRLTGTEPGLVGYWPLDDGAGTSAEDLTRNRNYGAVQEISASDPLGPGTSLTTPPQWPVTSGLLWDDNEIDAQILDQFFINQGLAAGQFLTLNSANANGEVSQSIVVYDTTTATTTPLGESDSDTLDRLQRFIRLAEALGWSFADLDLALRSIKPPPNTAIDDDALKSLAAIEQLQAQLSLEVDELCALWSDLDTFGISNGPTPQDLFDRTFNYPTSFVDPTGTTGAPPYRPLYDQNPLYVEPVVTWQPAQRQTPPAQMARTHLCGALQLDDTSLSLLTEFLFPGASTDDTLELQLDVPTLSLFYRHARLARALNLPLAQFLFLLRLLKIGHLNPIKMKREARDPIKIVAEIVGWVGWMRASKLNVAQLAYLTTAQPNPWINPGYNPEAVGSLLASMFQSSQTLRLTSRSFLTPGSDAANATALFQQLKVEGRVDANGVVREPGTDRGIEGGSDIAESVKDSLSDNHGVGPVVPALGPSKATLLKAQVAQDLFVTESLAAFFNCSPELMAATQELVFKSYSLPQLHINQLLIDLPPGAPVSDDVSKLMAALALDLYLARAFNLTPREVFGLARQPRVFQLSAFGSEFNWILEDLRTISEYKHLTVVFADASDELLEYFKMASERRTVPTQAAQEKLAEITGWPVEQIATLELQNFWPLRCAFDTVEQVAALNQCFSLAQTLGVDIEFMLGLRQLNALKLGDPDASPDLDVWGVYQAEAHDLAQVIAAKYGNSITPQVLASIEGRLEELKRDILAGFLLWELSFGYDDIKTTDDLYDFLLVDVDMSSVVQISQLKAGLNSLQLYVQSTQMNLEAEVANQIPRLWWSWMSHYRVWQANREVFLYPENYVNPALRRFKTPLFEQLESSLQQGNITPALVDGALTNYLEGLSAVDNLEIVASYRARVKKAVSSDDEAAGLDTLFIFGRTRSAPATFYYRTLRIFNEKEPEDNWWTPWQEINLGINAAEITPVYAFEKLFIFWVEQSQKSVNVANSGGNGQPASDQITNASIKYSFQKLDRSWAPEQTLEQNLVISVNGPSSYYPTTDPTSVAWKRVQAFVDDHSDQIIVIYGNLVAPITDSPTQAPRTGNAEIDVFNHMVFESLLFSSTLAGSSYLTSLVPPWTVGNSHARDRVTLKVNPAAQNFCTGKIVGTGPSQLAYLNLPSINPQFNDLYPGPVSFFPLNGLIADLVTGNQITVLDNPTWGTSAGNPLGADRRVLQFTGQTQGFNEVVSLWPGSLSAEFWVLLTDTSLDGNIFAFSQSPFPNGAMNGYVVYLSGQMLMFAQTETAVNVNIAALANEWTCVTVTLDASAKKIALYQNGSLCGTADLTSLDQINAIYVGCPPKNNTDMGGFLGDVAEVTVWERLLSLEEIQQRYHERTTPSLPLLTAGLSPYVSRVEPTHNQPGWFTFDNGNEAFLVTPHTPPEVYESTIRSYLPINFFPLDDGSGGAVTDLITKTSATINGSSSWTTYSSTPPGNQRHVLQFNSNSTYFDESLGNLMPPSYTAEIWVKLDFTSGTQYLLSILSLSEGGDNTIETSGGAVLLVEDGQFQAGFQYGSGSNSVLGAATTDWAYLVITVDSNNSYLGYLNGEPTPAQTATPLDDSNIYLIVGRTDGMGFNGYVANVGFWPRVLGPDEIKARYQRMYPLLNAGPEIIQTEISQGHMFRRTDEIMKITPAPPSGTGLQSSRSLLTLSFGNAANQPRWFDFSGVKLRFTRISTHVVSDLQRKLFIGGPELFLSLESQCAPELKFDRFKPTASVIAPASKLLDFNGAYGTYFWELFFYAPFLIANTLSTNQKFQLAQKWFQYIFNPTESMDNHGLVGCWPLNGNALDIAGPNNGTVWPDKDQPPEPTFVETVFADGSTRQVFNSPTGYDNNIGVANAPNLDITKAITLEGWCYLYNLGTDDSWMIEKEVDGTFADPWYVYRLSVSQGTFTFNVGVNKTWVGVTGGKAAINQWYYVAGTYDGYEARLYVNGELIGTQPLSTLKPPITPPAKIDTSAQNVVFGGDTFFGQLADLRIWNVAFTPERIMTHYLEQRAPLERFWRFRPFLNQTPDSLKENLSSPQQIAVYEYDPFDPDALARLRSGAYEKGIVMRYLENLIKWGDQLFAQYTWETISEATMLYTEALDLLGPKPEQVGDLPAPPVKTVEDFTKEFGSAAQIPEFLVQLENDIAYTPPAGGLQLSGQPFNLLNSYFCVPVNRFLLTLWQAVDNQLYKIRHGENIKGQPQPLPLFSPPLNPAALVKAGAGAGSASSRPPASSPNIPYYRFSYLIDRARDFTSQVVQLGSSLLSALERQDAEQLALIQNSNEATILNLTTQIKQNEIEQLQQSAAALEASLAAAQERQQTYAAWLAGKPGPDRSTNSSQDNSSGSDNWTESLSRSEVESLGLLEGSFDAHRLALATRMISSPLYLLPSIFGLADGGMEFGQSLEALAGSTDSFGVLLGLQSQAAGMVAQFQRRDQEWLLQYELAGDDMAQIEAQLAASQTALASAQRDLQVHQEQITQNQAIGAFYQSKFTSEQLYQWLAGRLSTIYFQSYQLAFALAQEAQMAFQYEQNSDKNYLDYSAWDSLEKGLTAGDSLAFSLDQLEKANIDAGIRHLAIEKTISLLQVNPQAVLDLKQTGQCSFALTEQLFDYDFPGQYNRKIASVSITIPAIVGPYQNIHATLTQTANRVVLQPDINAVTYLLPGGDKSPGPPLAIRSNWNINQQVALSRGSNDSGLFELNFNDPRYLPFEGTGAISNWTLQMPQAANAIEFNSISDVIIQLKFTAQDGGNSFRQEVITQPAIKSFTGLKYLSLRQLFPEAWHSFRTPTSGPPTLKFPLLRAMFPLNLEPSTVLLGTSNEIKEAPAGAITIQWLVAEGDTKDLPQLTLNQQAVTNSVVELVVPEITTSKSGPVPLSSFGPTVLNTLVAAAALPEQVLDIVLIIPFTGDLAWSASNG